jgi:hypothetical protein
MTPMTTSGRMGRDDEADLDTRPTAGDGALPADPGAYDSPRNEAARRKGLAAPYIAGGDDPDLPETLRRERRDVRLLLAMAIGVALIGFVLGLIQVLAGLGG